MNQVLSSYWLVIIKSWQPIAGAESGGWNFWEREELGRRKQRWEFWRQTWEGTERHDHEREVKELATHRGSQVEQLGQVQMAAVSPKHLSFNYVSLHVSFMLLAVAKAPLQYLSTITDESWNKKNQFLHVLVNIIFKVHFVFFKVLLYMCMFVYLCLYAFYMWPVHIMARYRHCIPWASGTDNQSRVLRTQFLAGRGGARL